VTEIVLPVFVAAARACEDDRAHHLQGNADGHDASDLQLLQHEHHLQHSG
jgi:hypothetical protein